MALSDAQLPALRTAIDTATDPTFVGYRTNGQTTLMAGWFNEPASPAFIVWRTSTSIDTIYGNGFDWPQVDNVSEQRWRIWRELFDNPTRSCNPSKAAVRAGIDEVWVGTAGKLAVRAQVYTHCKRNVTRGERLYVAGTGTDPSPGTLVYEGQITDFDISRALALP